jgi:phosphoglycerate dehydrogenase-like enzyme
MNPALPLAQQVANARVLIPTTGLVNAEVIAAAPHCKLIAQPAAGTANIDKDEAKRRGIPVTYAPGGVQAPGAKQWLGTASALVAVAAQIRGKLHIAWMTAAAAAAHAVRDMCSQH